jgi:polysaccharide deacetylase family protein (PEP-CTERM system associated)
MEVKTGPNTAGTGPYGRMARVPLSAHSLPQAASHTPGRPAALCTVTLEDYYRSAALRPWIRAENWYRFDRRLEASTARTLEFLASCQAQATFFVAADLVAEMPVLLRSISGAGHELAAAGDPRVSAASLGRSSAAREAVRWREELEQVSGQRVYGFRSAAGWLRREDLWLLDVLAESGYAYDSSIRPALLSDPLAPKRNGGGSVLRLSNGLSEVAISSVGIWGVRVPIGGGSAFRLLPWRSLRRAIARRAGDPGHPYVMHIRTWELDPDQPQIRGTSAVARLRHYRNLDRMSARLRDVLASRRGLSIASHLALRSAHLPGHVSSNGSSASHHRPDLTTASPQPPTRPRRTPVTLVVPCFNEEQSLRYLERTLESVQTAYRDQYTFAYLFVDDCSTDGTWDLLHELFGHREDCTLVRHPQNRGVAAAIQTGLRQSRTDIVCSIDCDCTYDPHELGRMIPLLGDGVDVVTASPYHPAGHVRNVPAWRLLLSKTLSRMYRVVLRQKLFTYTSCFRVYRRETVASLDVRHPGFLGVAELITRLDGAGRRVVEYPTTLEVRVLGHSKMRVLRTAIGHAGLLFEVVQTRVARKAQTPQVAS